MGQRVKGRGRKTVGDQTGRGLLVRMLQQKGGRVQLEGPAKREEALVVRDAAAVAAIAADDSVVHEGVVARRAAQVQNALETVFGDLQAE